ncbi:MAG: methyltransferase domain-containing protein [Acidocella sp.]|uniref:methyltransferase domain-containing protein n=1 Tax=Acidocella sp. TaxID=50710 RepID=UPI003FC0A9E4
MANTGKIRVAEHIEIEWLEGRSAQAVCPNCGYTGEVAQVLATDYTPPGQALRFVQQLCPRCSARFVDNMHTMDYEGEHLIELGWHSYQSQIGAGIWSVTAPLTRVSKPAGARVLEIGGAYGFGLDFCVQIHGWRGEGFDPSPLAAHGARALGLDLHQDYFTEANLAAGPWDVIVSTEVIEHLPDPPAFLRLMRQALADDGILVLTTPDAEWITPALDTGDLVSLLAPDAHLILQTARSLEHALRDAGFAHVAVRRESMTLIAYASPAPLALNEDFATGHAAYRRYLAQRAAQATPGSDVQLGFAGRALFEAVNAADWDMAETAWAASRKGAAKRFGYDLDTLTALPPGCMPADLAGLAQKIPLGLGVILFSRAMQRLGQGEGRAALRPLFQLALEATTALQSALAKRSLGDGLAGNIADIAAQELLLCAAEAAEPESVSGLLARGDVLAGWRGFVALVNAGAFTLAAALKDGLPLGLPGEDVPAGVRRDALLSLANFYLAPDADAARAFPVAEALGGEGAEILLGGFARLVNASRYEEALAAGRTYNIAALARGAGMAARDARLAQIVLDLAVGDPAEIPARLQGLEIEPARHDGLLLEAFIRLVNASRYDEALAFIAAHDVSALAARVGGEVAKNTGLARMVLDLAVGDPAEIPVRLRDLEIDPERRDGLLLEAFIRLVNASRYDEALAFITTHDVSALAACVGGEVANNTCLARMVLDLAVGDPAEIPARLEGLEIEPERRDGLLLEAFVRLVNGSRYNEALAFIATHDVSTLAERAGGEAANNTGIALMVLDLAVGDPAEIPARLRGLDIEPERRDALLLEAFIRLVNASRYDEALKFIATHDVSALAARVGGEVAKNTGLASMVLDLAVGDPAEIPARLAGLEIEPERRDVLLLEAFIRLVNASRYTEAQDSATTNRVPELLRRTGEKTSADAAIALAVLELELGDPALVPGHLAGLDVPPERAEALTLGAFTALVNTARYDEAEALAAAEPCFARLPDMRGEAAADARFAAMMLDLQRGRLASAVEKMAALEQASADGATLGALYVDAFIRLVNDGAFALARQLAQEEGVERRLQHCTAPARQDALVALLLLELQPGGTAARVPDRVTALRPTQICAAQLRELTLIAFTTLVNQQEFATARALLAPVEPELLALRPPFDPAGRDALFAAGALYLEDEQEWRRCASCFGRLRDALAKSAPPGAAPEPLFWPALRGEVVALHRLERYEEATLLLQEFIGTYPDAPEDLRQQIEPHETLCP